MKILKNLLFLITLLVIVYLPKVEALNKVDIYFFYGEGCPHCAKEEIVLEELKAEYSNLEVHYYEVWYDQDNQKTLQGLSEYLNFNVSGVPFTVIGTKHYVGYDEDNTKDLLATKIKEYSNNSYTNDMANYLAGLPSPYKVHKETKLPDEEQNRTVSVPFVGKVALKELSLPVIAVVLGTLDGFNPCAMWVLLFLISMLIGMENRKRMWILGIAFLTTSALVYMLFMLAWLNFTSMIGTLVWLRLLIALIAIVGGFINLKSYYDAGKEDGCTVVDDTKRKKLFERVKHITREKTFIIALFGVMALAASVNIIELACSAGFPVIFTGILTVNDLSGAGHFMYVLLYIFFYLLDDIIVFIIAMKTMEVTGISTKYGRWSHLIGGILMLIIGALLIIKPEWLMFNF